MTRAEPGSPPSSDPTEIAYYVCYGPRRAGLADLAGIAEAYLRIEECLQ